MTKLSDPLTIRGKTIRNRICVPPMVIFGLADNNHVSSGNIAHYQALAHGGAGLVIVEATCVSSSGRLSKDQLGIWQDSQTEGFARLAEAVHAEGAVLFMQIHHAGVKSVGSEHACPSDYAFTGHTGERIIGQAMTGEQIDTVRQQFVDGARRAYQAGFDGVELHGCHGYLISQFLNHRVNRRQDHYGKHPESLVIEIVEGIRATTSSDFFVGIRLGFNEPDPADGLSYAAKLAECVDFLDISHGFFPPEEIVKPADFPFSGLVYGAAAVRQVVDRVPVFAVGGITTAEIAIEILAKTGVAMVDVARASLVNANWAKEALTGSVSRTCRQCRQCVWVRDRQKCPGLARPATRIDVPEGESRA